MTTENDTAPAAATPTRARAAKPSTAESTSAPVVRAISKSDTVIKLLLRAKGATPLELIAATNWQPHSVRAFLSGLRKKGRTIVREARKDGEFAYRIVVAHAPAAAQPAEGPRECATGDVTSTETARA